MLMVKPIAVLFAGDTVVVAMSDDSKVWQEHCYTSVLASRPNSNSTK
jgi:hypothetical protein